MSDQVTELRARNQAVWSAGHWDEVSKLLPEVGRRLLDRVGIEPGMDVLDVGTGSGGTVAIPAAERGARVVGSDLVAEHFEDARRRAAEAGVEVEWVEADAEDLPFDDDSFDRVLSTFGHMFALRHEVAAAELARVVRPDGLIGLCTWVPRGANGAMFATVAKHLPPPPDFAQPPPKWGDEEHVRSLLEPLGLELEFEHHTIAFEFDSPEEHTAFFEENFGPIAMAKVALGERFAALRDDLTEVFREHNAAQDGGYRLEPEYLLTVARPR